MRFWFGNGGLFGFTNAFHAETDSPVKHIPYAKLISSDPRKPSGANALNGIAQSTAKNEHHAPSTSFRISQILGARLQKIGPL
jgi:hypothetical protein